MSVELANDELIARVIAFYLPQFHPIRENDEWWGKGFTEWNNVTRARPLFPGHYQPHLPADLGFCDLRVAETRVAQAELARAYGVYGFCYYHYWFNGRRLLERPFNDVLGSGEPDFPFCLCWANENWTRRWDGYESEVLLPQTYGPEDDVNHIRSLVSAFSDPRYIRINGRPLFILYRAELLPDVKATIDRWRAEAERMGIGELFLCKVEKSSDQGKPRELGFDASVQFHPQWDMLARLHHKAWHLLRSSGIYKRRRVFDYDRYVELALREPLPDYPRFECVTPSWDNTARWKDPVVLKGSTPESYGKWLRAAVSRSQRIDENGPIVFINAWNEWAEGNHLEPCLKWGRAYLEATRAALSSASQ
jgi:lipopolysaccharide biosynthesis protein